MYIVKIKTSKPWQVRKKLLGKTWTVMSNSSSMKEAEKDVAYLTNSIEDYGHLLKDVRINYQISKDGNILWDKEEHYNG